MRDKTTEDGVPNWFLNSRSREPFSVTPTSAMRMRGKSTSTPLVSLPSCMTRMKRWFPFSLSWLNDINNPNSSRGSRISRIAESYLEISASVLSVFLTASSAWS